MYQKVCNVLKNVTIEPIYCIVSLAYVLTTEISANLQLEMACLVNAHFNETICSSILKAHDYLEQKQQVQIIISQKTSWISPLLMALPACFMLFAGAYSDKFQVRKPFIIIPIIGKMISTIGLILCDINKSKWPVEIELLFDKLFPAYTIFFNMATSTYIAAISSKVNRTLQLLILSIMEPVSKALTTFSVNYIFYEIHYIGIFSISLVLFATSVFLVIFTIKEPKDVTDANTKHTFCDMFDFKHVTNTFKLIFKKEPGKQRIKLGALLVASFLTNGSIRSTWTMIYRYTQIKLQWTIAEYTSWQSLRLFSGLIGSLIAIPIIKKIQIDDALLGTIGHINNCISCILLTFANTSIVFYTGAAIRIYTGLIPSALVSLMTKLVSASDIAKIVCLQYVLEVMSPILFDSTYNILYEATISTLPGMYFLITAIYGLISIIILLCIYFQKEPKILEENTKF